MKLIDFERKGNLVRLYLGDDANFTGDDWDDYPYEDNASPVYDEYIKAIIDYAVPCEYIILEPSDNPNGSDWCKNDMKCGYVPMFVIGDSQENEWASFSQVIADKKVKRIYMNEEFNKEDFKDCILIKEQYPKLSQIGWYQILSRSYKHTPICKLTLDIKYQKKQANRMVRRTYKNDCPTTKGNHYKKIYDSYYLYEYVSYVPRCNEDYWYRYYLRK